MDYHWSLKVKKDPLCTGGRWLIVGRLDGARGARVFKERPDIQRVRLRLLTRETRVEPIGDGRYRQIENARELARFELTAQRAGELDPNVLRKTLEGQRCERIVKSLLDDVEIFEDGGDHSLTVYAQNPSPERVPLSP